MFHFQKISLQTELQNLLMNFLKIQGVTMPGFTSPKDVISVLHELPYNLTKEIVQTLLNPTIGELLEKSYEVDIPVLHVMNLKQMTTYQQTKTQMEELLLSVQETRICELELDGIIHGRRVQDAQRKLFTGFLKLKESGGSTPSSSQEIPLTILSDVELKNLQVLVS